MTRIMRSVRFVPIRRARSLWVRHVFAFQCRDRLWPDSQLERWFFRFTPQRGHLERSCRVSIPNPWGTAFDEWGQDYFTDTSDPNLRWMLPASIKVPYGDFAPNPWNLLEQHASDRRPGWSSCPVAIFRMRYRAMC